MSSNSSKSTYYSNFNVSINQLERMIHRLMPRLHHSWKHILLEDSQNQMTGTEVARTILRECGRTDVKVCVSQDEQNAYTSLLNVIGLSKDVAGSRSVIAAAIAAHEVGHALQPEFLETLGSILSKSPFAYLSDVGCIIIILIIHSIPLLSENKKSIDLWPESQAQNQVSNPNDRIHIYWRQHPLHLVMTLVIMAFNLLFLPFILPIWGLALLFILLSVFCESIRRLFIFLNELHASLSALRLLKQYKILDRRERGAAKKILLAAGLTYARL
jgi:uncharacterized protein